MPAARSFCKSRIDVMDNELRENLAKDLATLHHKHVHGTTQKWEKMAASERSLWRLLAEKAYQVVSDAIKVDNDF